MSAGRVGPLPGGSNPLRRLGARPGLALVAAFILLLSVAVLPLPVRGAPAPRDASPSPSPSATPTPPRAASLASATKPEASAPAPRDASPSPSPSATPMPVTTGRAAWSVEADNRVFVQYWDWFRPSTGENEYSFLADRLRGRLRYDAPRLHGCLEIQDVQMVGLPTNAVLPAPQGQLGGGAAEYAVIRHPSINSAGLRQAWLRVGDPQGWEAQVGRQEYRSALEVLTRDPSLDWILRNRIGSRFIGVQDFLDFGRTYDAVRLDVDSPFSRATGFAARPTQGGYDPHFGTEMTKVFISNVAWTIKRSRSLPDSTAQVFWTHYDDERNVPFTDNRPAAQRGFVNAQGGIHVDMLGFHFVTRLGKHGDALAWYSHQAGKWGTLTHRADGYTVEAGYRLDDMPLRPWFRAGFSSFSGDANPSDRLHGTFFSPLGTNRNWARFPFYNGSNLNDVLAQVILEPGRRTTVRIDWDWLTLANPADLWMSGGGAFQNQGASMGFSGKPSGGSASLANLLGINVDHRFDEHNSVSLYYGLALGGRVVRAIYPRNPAGQVFFLEYNLRFPRLELSGTK